MRRAGTSWACAALLAALVAATPVNAQELSEKATRTFMEYAWSLTPEAFTKPNGETIQIDKKKKAEGKEDKNGKRKAEEMEPEASGDESDGGFFE